MAPGARSLDSKTVVWLLVAMVLGSRIGLVAAGMVGGYLLPSGTTVQQNMVWHTPVSPVLEMWTRWDAEWYLYVAERGYDVTGLVGPRGRERPDTATGFFPLYPLLIRALAPVLGFVGAGWLISNLALAFSVVLLYRLTKLEIGNETGCEAGLFAVAAMLAWPMTLFLSAVYAESLFLALTLATFLAARNRRFGWAGVAGLAAALTRPHGVLLAPSLAFEWWVAWRREGAPARGAVGALGPPVGMALFAGWCWLTVGDPLAFLARQERWRGSLSWPWTAFVRWTEGHPQLHGAHASILELLLAVLVLAALPVVVRRLRPSLALFTVLTLLVTLGSTLWSFGRLMLGVFPLYMAAGHLAASGRRALVLGWIWVGSSLAAVLMALFAAWWWAG